MLYSKDEQSGSGKEDGTREKEREDKRSKVWRGYRRGDFKRPLSKRGAKKRGRQGADFSDVS